MRFLLGEWAGEVVDDPDRRLVMPDSIVVTQRPDRLRGKVLSRLRRLGSVGLFHVGDDRYRARLDAYGSFAFVWRTYYHSALDGLTVRQVPLGPRGIDPIVAEPSEAARRPPGERLYTWSFAGTRSTSRDAMLDAMAAVDGGSVEIGPVPPDDPEALAADHEVLASTIFAPCAMDGSHLEGTRIYDALEHGAIPIVERRRWLDYFGLLYGPGHPLPSVRSWAEAPELIRRLLADPQALGALQRRVVDWWARLKAGLAEEAQQDVEDCVVGLRTPSVFGPLDKPAPRWRNKIEHLRQQDAEGLKERARLRRAR
ncbi:MAG TPA: hypothetical protein VIL36_08815 [Acidimicrobiales bacterium]